MFTSLWLKGAPRRRRRHRGVPARRNPRRPAFDELEDRAVPAAALATDIRLDWVTATGFSDLAVTYEIWNRDAPAFDLSFYRSGNSRFDAADTLLSKIRLSDPADLSVGPHTKTFAVGAGAGLVALPGVGLAAEVEKDYAVLAVADPWGRVAEKDAHPFREDNTAALTGAYHVPGGAVYVHGGPLGDSLTISPDGGNLRVDLNGAVHTYAADVTAVRARLHDGDDALNGTTAAVPLFAWAGDGNDSLVGGAASDVLVGGAGDDDLKGYGPASDLFGPLELPPGGVTFEQTGGDLAAAGGVTLEFSGFNTAGLRGLWWGPTAAGLSMDGPVDVAGEHLSFNPGSSDLEHGIAEWRGTADFTYFLSIIPPIWWTDTLTTRLVMTVTDPSDNPISLVERSAAGLPGSGAVVSVADTSTSTGDFEVNLRMEAWWSGAWRPARVVFDTHTTLPWHYVDVAFEHGFWHRYVDDDVLTGGDGNDTLTGAFGNDRVAETARRNLTLAGDTTAATLVGRGTDELRGVGLVSLTGTAAANRLDASGFAERVELYGKAGDDRLYGGSADADWLSGGPGNDYLNGGDGRDWVFERANVSMTLTDTRLLGLGTDRLVSVEGGRLFGGAGANVLNASGFTLGAVWMWGEGGNDLLIGTGTLDDLFGGAGNDTIRGGAGNDVIRGEAGKDSLLGGVGDDYLMGGDGNDHLDGGADWDTLDGGPGTDTWLNCEVPINLP